ncbi:jg12777, partial [Pararge aegeria aegeria]
MVVGKVLWFSVLLIGTTWGQPVPDPQIMFPCPQPCSEPNPDPCSEPPPCEDALPPCPQSEPPCSQPEPHPCPGYQETIQLRPCNPNDAAVHYVYGQAPTGTVIIKPGLIRFPTPQPIVVKPGEIKLPTPPAIWVKPAPIQPPTPSPIR